MSFLGGGGGGNHEAATLKGGGTVSKFGWEMAIWFFFGDSDTEKISKA